MTVRSVARKGWIPDLPDHRDHAYAVAPGRTVALPPSVDLRPGCPPVYDQGQLGSCTANAIGGAIEFDLIKQGLPAVVPSRLFIYYNERAIEGTVGSDSGAMIRDGIKTVASQGACSEALWPYREAWFRRRPLRACYRAATGCVIGGYARLETLDDMRGRLASGFPFVFGFSVYEAFESEEVALTGVVPMPTRGERLLGGHAVLAVGYDDADDGGRFVVRNSWGTSFGMEGYFTLPYAYLQDRNLADDLWSIESVSGPVKLDH